jgi:hypothetical protein
MTWGLGRGEKKDLGTEKQVDNNGLNKKRKRKKTGNGGRF